MHFYYTQINNNEILIFIAMNKNHFLSVTATILLYIATNNTGYASNADTSKTLKGISISYSGIITSNYGIQLGLEKYYLQTEKYKIIGVKSLVIQRKSDAYTLAGVILGSTLRRTFKWGFYFEQGIQIGYLGSYYDFDIYKTNSDGKIINVGRKWFSSGTIGYSAGLGYDFSKTTKINLQLFVKPSLYYRFPYNDNIFFSNNYSLEAGIILHPKWLKW
jgi:hypothetical protein